MPRKDKSGTRAQPENFHGEVRHVRGIGLRIDTLGERTKDRLKAETTGRVKAATVDKVRRRVQSASEVRKNQRKLAGLERARDILPVGSPKRAAADRVIAKFKKDNGL